MDLDWNCEIGEAKLGSEPESEIVDSKVIYYYYFIFFFFLLFFSFLSPCFASPSLSPPLPFISPPFPFISPFLSSSPSRPGLAISCLQVPCLNANIEQFTNCSPIHPSHVTSIHSSDSINSSIEPTTKTPSRLASLQSNPPALLVKLKKCCSPDLRLRTAHSHACLNCYIFKSQLHNP